MGIAVGDLNSDGKLDLVVSSYTSNAVSVFLGNGDGTFQSPVPYTTDSEPLSIAIGDFNSDGALDVAVATNCDAGCAGDASAVSVLLGNGDGTLRPYEEYKTQGLGPGGIIAADVTGSGILDLD